MKVLLTPPAIKALIQLGENLHAPCPRSAIDELLKGGYVDAKGFPSELVLTEDGRACLRSLGIYCPDETPAAAPRKRPWPDS